MFQISNRFESVWLGFEPLKVGQSQFSSFCTLHTFLGSPVWRAIKFDQLTIILKFLLHCIVDVRNLLCFKFQLLTNPFEWFSNAIPNGISNFSLVSVFADWLVALFVALYLQTHDWSSKMVCTPVLFSENSPSVSVCKTWRIHMHTFPGQFHLQKSLSVSVPSCKILSSPLWASAICVLWFVMSPNPRFIMSSWQGFIVPVFVFPSSHLPSFPSQIQTQIIIF